MKTYSYNEIARYAEDDMTAEEKQEFEQALSTDTALQEQLALYRDVHDSMYNHFNPGEDQYQLQQTLQDMRDEFFNPAARRTKVVPMARKWQFAISVAAMLVVAVILWKPWQKEDLYGKYAQLKMINPAERGDNTDSLSQLAAMAFNAEDFITAEKNLEQVRRVKPDDSFTNFYYGVSLLQNGKSAQSRVVLSTVANGESAFKYQATFFQALTYLKEGNKTACREWLQKIPADASFYTKAQELLNKL
jgi:hypothetical protein